jgi:hypothetical protein
MAAYKQVKYNIKQLVFTPKTNEKNHLDKVADLVFDKLVVNVLLDHQC